MAVGTFAGATSSPRTNRTLRLAIYTETHSALLFSASDIEVHTPESLLQQKYLARLGPDALDERVVWRDILRRLQDRRFAGRSLAALYLDQSFVAGIGNYLRSEILFHSRVNPFDRPKDLTRRQLGTLARNTLDLTRQAYATAGVTNTPGRVKRLQAKVSRRRYRHLVFDRRKESCYQCGDTVERIEAAAAAFICARAASPVRGTAV